MVQKMSLCYLYYFNLERFVMIKIVLSEHKKLMYKSDATAFYFCGIQISLQMLDGTLIFSKIE